MAGWRFNSGTWFVVVLVGVALLTGAVTWSNYRRENPTSVEGRLMKSGSEWTAEARFDLGRNHVLAPGSGVVLTSPAFPGLKMSGVIAKIESGSRVAIAVQSGPPGDADKREVPCVVTVDYATAPVEK